MSDALDQVAHLSMRERVFLIEDRIKEELKPVDCPLKHYFAPGVCAREMFIPAGTIVTGRIHKYQTINILSGGEMDVLTENGVVRVRAPFTIVSPPGTKRIALAYTDCVWTTILRTDETNPDKLEAIFTVGTEKEYLEFAEAQKLIEVA